MLLLLCATLLSTAKSLHLGLAFIVERLPHVDKGVLELRVYSRLPLAESDVVRVEHRVGERRNRGRLLDVLCLNLAGGFLEVPRAGFVLLLEVVSATKALTARKR